VSTLDSQPARPALVMQISDNASLLETATVVPRESKILARKTIAEAAKSPEDCREMLKMLGIYDLDTLAEPGDDE
jgi:hypothetical protein